MRFRAANSTTKPGINLTPLMDIVFILLIFFAVSTSFMFVGAIEVDLPKADTSSAGDNKAVVRVVVTKDNKYFIDDKAVDGNNIKASLDEAIEANPGATLMIEADLASLHGVVVTVIDAGKAAGFENFAIATEEANK